MSINMVSESIFSGKRVIVPMAEVHHIEKRKEGIQVVLNGTKYNFENDTWENAVWIGDYENQSQEFIKAWCLYRYEVEHLDEQEDANA